MESQIEILFNKRKLLPYAGGALLFVLAGALILRVAMELQSQVIMKLFLFTLGLISILFFGLIALLTLPKLFTNKAGLVIGNEGIWDYSSGVSAGFVPWGAIKKINYTYSGSTVFMVLMLKNPDKFIGKQTNPVKKLAMHLNYKISGSPVHILASVLDTDLHKLKELIAARRYPTAADSSQMHSSKHQL